MAFTIAFAGKGGTGKTSLAGLTIKYLTTKRKGPVLAVDADSNSCLNEALGITVDTTIGRMREESVIKVRQGERPGGMSAEEYFDYQVQQSIIESTGIDLMVMGRPEGSGCYCVANNIIRKYTDILSEKYPYVVIDNEAGMEHLSRRTTHKVDILLIVSDPTAKGVLTCKRISDLVDEIQLDIDRRIVIINRVHGDEDAVVLTKVAEQYGLTVGGVVPQDEMVFRYDLEGKPVAHLPEDTPSVRAYFNILDGLQIP